MGHSIEAVSEEIPFINRIGLLDVKTQGMYIITYKRIDAYFNMPRCVVGGPFIDTCG